MMNSTQVFSMDIGMASLSLNFATGDNDGFAVQRQMKCAEEDSCLNREWTRIHAKSCSDPVGPRFELLLNRHEP